MLCYNLINQANQQSINSQSTEHRIELLQLSAKRHHWHIYFNDCVKYRMLQSC